MQVKITYIRKKFVINFKNVECDITKYLKLFKEIVLDVGKDLVRDYKILIRTPTIYNKKSIAIDIDISVDEDLEMISIIIVNSLSFHIKENYPTVIYNNSELDITIYENEEDVITKQIDENYYVKRNDEIYRLHKNRGLTYRDISHRFGISVERTRQIFLRKDAIVKRIEKRDFFEAIRRSILSIGSGISAARVYNSVERLGLISDIENGKDSISNYSDEYLLSIPRVGVETVVVLREAQKLFDSWNQRTMEYAC